jgi:alpha-L-fucosidase 2
MGGMVFGRINNERIALNESTFWSGRPNDYTNPEAYNYFDTIRNLVFAEKYKEAEKVINEHFYGIPKNQQAYQPLGDLLLNFKNSDNVKDYYRELDMETGVAKVTYKDGDAEFTREIFMSYPDRVMVIRLTCNKPGKITLEAKLKSPYLENVVASSGKLVMNGTWKGPLPENALSSLIANVEGTGLNFQTVMLFRRKGIGFSDSV